MYIARYRWCRCSVVHTYADTDGTGCSGPRMVTDTDGCRWFGSAEVTDTDGCRYLWLTDRYNKNPGYIGRFLKSQMWFQCILTPSESRSLPQTLEYAVFRLWTESICISHKTSAFVVETDVPSRGWSQIQMGADGLGLRKSQIQMDADICGWQIVRNILHRNKYSIANSSTVGLFLFRTCRIHRTTLWILWDNDLGLKLFFISGRTLLSADLDLETIPKLFQNN